MELVEKRKDLQVQKDGHAGAEGDGSGKNGKGKSSGGALLSHADRAAQTFGDRVVKRLWQEFSLDEREMAIMAALFDMLLDGETSVISIVYAKLDEWEKAFYIADSARNEDSYFRIARHAVKVGEMDIARRAAYPALINLKLSDERYLFELSFPEVAELFRQMGDKQQAVRIINRSLDYMEGSGLGGYWRVQELSSSAVVFIKMGNEAEALKLLHKAFESASGEGDECPKIDSLLRIAGVYVENQIPVGEEERAFVRTVMA